MLADRTIRLSPPANALQKLAVRCKDAVEAWVARRSLLADRPVYDPRLFPWIEPFEQEWRLIRSELDQILPRRTELPDFHEILEPVSTITQDRDWKTYFLAGPGMDCSDNTARCPETTRLLRGIPGLRTAMFSILSPGKHIPPHRGAFNGLLRFHLGLLVPQPAEHCRIRIAGEDYSWGEGEALIFDDTFQHEVSNNTDGVRVVLFVDFERPLKQPWAWLMSTFLNLANRAPTLKKAGLSQAKWAQRFYR